MAYTSNKKPGGLNAAVSLAGANNIVVDQAGTVVRATLNQVEAKVFDGKTQVTPNNGDVVVIRRGSDIRQLLVENMLPTGSVTNAMLGGSIVDSKLNTISTAGKVVNSATSATTGFSGTVYDNGVGANKIVTRDGSGNFAAGTVTASLSGNASTATTLQTGRTVALTGDVAYTSPSFNGSANVTAAATIQPNAVTTAKIIDDAVNFAKLQKSVAAGLSVIGRNTSGIANFAEINAATDGHVLRRSGTGLGFGQVVSAGIATGAVTANSLASNAVTTVKILDANVTRDKLEDSGVVAGTYNNNDGQVRPFTVDAKGRVTAIGTAMDISLNYNPQIVGTPYKYAVTAATTSNLTATYNNGTDGVGATLTNSGVIGQLTVDGVDTAVGFRILVKNQSNANHNGIYTVTNNGTAGAAWVLTRATDADTSTETRGAVATVARGVQFGAKLFTTDFKTFSDPGSVAQNWYQVVTTGDSETVSTAMLADNAVDNAKIRDSAALSVIGRSVNSLGDPADITAGTDGHVLRRSGTTLGFGQVATAGIADSNVTNDKIASGVDAAKLTTGTLPIARIADGAVTAAKIADGAVTAGKLAAGVAIPAGAIMPFAMNSAPSGWLAANGAAVSRSTYADLFSAISTTYGAGNGSTTFALPDLRGYFVRGSGTNGDGTAAGTFGAKQGFATSAQGLNVSPANHNHSYTDQTNFNTGGGVGGANANTGTQTLTKNTTSVSLDVTSSATETRPVNIAMQYCIKF